MTDRERKEPAKATGMAIHQRLLQEGLLCSARRGGSVLRFVPPFTTTFAQFDQSAEILDSAIREMLDEESRRR